MRTVHALAAIARRLNQAAGAPDIPALYFFTDPQRTPDPVAIARFLPAGAAIVYRHFGAPDRRSVAAQLASVARSRHLRLLIAADPALAERVGAHGAHWPNRLLPASRSDGGIATCSAHTAHEIVRASLWGADAIVLGPVFATQSASGNRALGLFRASQMARTAPTPVIALGGINENSARQLAGRGFAGIAAVSALAD
jgi:thiamine-phosphate pyrophosphorylase